MSPEGEGPRKKYEVSDICRPVTLRKRNMTETAQAACFSHKCLSFFFFLSINVSISFFVALSNITLSEISLIGAI